MCSLPGSPLEEGFAKDVPGRSRMRRCLSRPVEACRTCSEPAYIGDPCGHPRYSHAWLAHSQRTFVVQLASSAPRPVLGNPCKSAVMGSLSQDGHRDASKHTNSSWAGTRRPQEDPNGRPTNMPVPDSPSSRLPEVQNSQMLGVLPGFDKIGGRTDAAMLDWRPLLRPSSDPRPSLVSTSISSPVGGRRRLIGGDPWFHPSPDIQDQTCLIISSTLNSIGRLGRVHPVAA